MKAIINIMAHLNFDWDDILPSDSKAVDALNILRDNFGLGNVWYRLSSSSEGMHVMIAGLSQELDLVPTDYDQSFVLFWRNHFLNDYSLECQGRLNADKERSSHGFRIGRIFLNKNNNTSGEWKCYGLE